jgi:hypothetical protein
LAQPSELVLLPAKFFRRGAMDVGGDAQTVTDIDADTGAFFCHNLRLAMERE